MKENHHPQVPEIYILVASRKNNNETEYVQGVYTKHPTLKKESACN
jgi:hypothetical protein